MGRSEFSKALKALCAEGSQARKPPPPWNCKKSGCPGDVSDMIARLCYKEGMAGLWIYVCGRCSRVHQDHNQRAPSPELLARIEAQRKKDNQKRAQSEARKAASKQHKAAEKKRNAAEAKKLKAEEKRRKLEDAVRQAEDAELEQQQKYQDEEKVRMQQEEEDEREQQRKEDERLAHQEEKVMEDRRERDRKLRAKRRDRAQRAVNVAKKAAQKTQEARERLRAFIKGKKKRAGGEASSSSEDMSDDGDDHRKDLIALGVSDEFESHGGPSTSVFADRRNRSERSPSVERVNKTHSEKLQLVFWSKKEEQPVTVELKMRGEDKVVLADHECICKNESPNVPFEHWVDVTSRWMSVPTKRTAIYLDAILNALLVRKETVGPCLGLAEQIAKLQMARMVAELGEQAAADLVADARAAILAREKKAGMVWVVVWYNESDFPEAHQVETTGKKFHMTDLTKHPRLRSGDAIEYWMDTMSDWMPWDLASMSTCIHQGHTLLVHTSDAKSLPLLGLELEALALYSEEPGEETYEATVTKDVMAERVRSPSVEVMDGPPPGYKRGVRDARA
ncbi:hypothetical protein C8Q70DRAFT_1056971 [Cubamyces menziesii]|nr:hypothetical protein C8Q70DRAFT_1056971 [Cubamyces menziesii]